jgi:2-hydroxymuconate-semialdehyde hydrolase
MTAMESKYFSFEDYRVHYFEGGSGLPILMLHGVGPGTAIMGNFQPVLEPLAARFHIFAMDLIGFGNSDRKKTAPYFDADLWLHQALALIDKMPAGPIGIAGHSFGGALAMKLASRSDRIIKVMTSSSIGAPYRLNDALDGFWTIPADRAALRKSMERMVDSPAVLTDAMIEGRWDLLAQPGYSEFFAEMFTPPRQRFIDAGVLTDEEIAGLKVDLLMLHGRNDQGCPAEQTTLKVAERIPTADVVLLGRCGHNLPRERSAAYLDAAFRFFGPQS